jgi:hypothetical protein
VPGLGAPAAGRGGRARPDFQCFRVTPTMSSSRKLTTVLIFVGLAVSMAFMLYWKVMLSYQAHERLFMGLAGGQLLGDANVEPCNDFYNHVCGKFARQSLPAGHDQWLFAFDGVKERIAMKMHATLQTEPGDVGILFRSCTGSRFNIVIFLFCHVVPEPRLSSCFMSCRHSSHRCSRHNAHSTPFANVGADS